MQWTEAATLTDIGECFARYLEGSLPYTPSLARFFPETVPLVPLLARLNRSGKVITSCSQPACTPDDRSWDGLMAWQRAAIDGYVAPNYIGEVASLLGAIGCELSVSPPGALQRLATMLASRDPKSSHPDGDMSYFGYVHSQEEIAEFYGSKHTPWDDCDDIPGLHPDGIKLLQDCYQISVVDPEWGRNSVLWPALQQL
jgi:hypothetical protein